MNSKNEYKLALHVNLLIYFLPFMKLRFENCSCFAEPINNIVEEGRFMNVGWGLELCIDSKMRNFQELHNS